MELLRGRRLLRAGLLFAASLAADADRLGAQQPASSTVTGVVIDAATRAPVPGAFLAVGERGPRAIADSTGAFRLSAVAGGYQSIQIQRFGYLDLSLNLFVGESDGPLRVILQPEPIALEGVVSAGVAEVALSGTVRNARDGAGIPWASLTLTPDAVRKEGSASSDPEGVFRIDDVQTGRYLLRVQALGYHGQYVALDVTAPPPTLDLALEPDTVVQKGLAQFTRSLRSRRNYLPGSNRSFGQEQLHYTAAVSAAHFLDSDANVSLLPCPAGKDDGAESAAAAAAGQSTTGQSPVAEGGAAPVGGSCVMWHGGIIEPQVYVDELPMMAGLEVLASYHPSELHSIEVFNEGATIRAYTYEFMQKMAVRPRGFIIPETKLRSEIRPPQVRAPATPGGPG
jgi:hypothetical protein